MECILGHLIYPVPCKPPVLHLSSSYPPLLVNDELRTRGGEDEEGMLARMIFYSIYFKRVVSKRTPAPVAP
jgi:hypothetical protein